MVALLMRTPILVEQQVAALVVGEVVADEALLNPGLVINEGAGATWGGSVG